MFTFARVVMRVSWFSVNCYLAGILLRLLRKPLLNFGGKFKSTYLKVRTIIQSTFSIFPWILTKNYKSQQNNDRRDKAEIRNSSHMCLWILLVLLMHMWAAACMYGVINSQIVSNKTCMGSIIYFIEGRSSSRLVYIKFEGPGQSLSETPVLGYGPPWGKNIWENFRDSFAIKPRNKTILK